MSGLLSLGLRAAEIAKINSYVSAINGIVLQDARSCQNAINAYSKIIQILNIANFDHNATNVTQALAQECNWTMTEDRLGGGRWPTVLLVQVPDFGYVRCDNVSNGNWEWRWEGMDLVRNVHLYGDRDVLEYSANPLDYLKFRHLPDERQYFNTTEDESANDEYSGLGTMYLGIELEVERKKDTPRKINHMVIADLGADYAILKKDSSIGDGFEIVTAPATLRFHKSRWDKFFDNSGKLVSSWASGKCGMHVHISRGAFTPLHLGKFVTFMNNNENRDFVTTIAGRSSEYSKFYENKIFHVKSKLLSHIKALRSKQAILEDAAEIKNLEVEVTATKQKLRETECGGWFNLVEDLATSRDRRVSVNLAKKNTVEIRIFRGNVSKVGMLKNLEFVAAVVDFTREATMYTSVLTKEEREERKRKNKENTDYALHYTYFVEWLERDKSGLYENLKMYLGSRKLTNKYTRKKLSDKAPPDKRTSDDDIAAVA